jgi:hypothetical protein
MLFKFGSSGDMVGTAFSFYTIAKEISKKYKH